MSKFKSISQQTRARSRGILLTVERPVNLRSERALGGTHCGMRGPRRTRSMEKRRCEGGRPTEKSRSLELLRREEASQESSEISSGPKLPTVWS